MLAHDDKIRDLFAEVEGCGWSLKSEARGSVRQSEPEPSIEDPYVGSEQGLRTLYTYVVANWKASNRNKPSTFRWGSPLLSHSVRSFLQPRDPLADAIEVIISERDDTSEEVDVRQLLAEARHDADAARQECREMKKERDELLDAYREICRSNDALLETLEAKRDGHLCMFEFYSGIVEKVDDGRFFVVFETDGDPVEQIYTREQFLAGHEPKEHQRVSVYIFALDSTGGKAVDQDEITLSAEEGDDSGRRTNTVSGDYSF